MSEPCAERIRRYEHEEILHQRDVVAAFFDKGYAYAQAQTLSRDDLQWYHDQIKHECPWQVSVSVPPAEEVK